MGYPRRLLWLAPSRSFGGLRAKFARAEELVKIVDGRPSPVALPLTRWRTPGDHPGGLIWCAPLVPMRPSAARTLSDTVQRVASAHGMDPLVTMTTLSDRSFDCSIPLLFDGGSKSESARAHRCARELHDELWGHGYFPYRVGTHDMPWLVDRWGQHASVVAAVKRALDPRGVIAPGRYAPVERPTRSADESGAFRAAEAQARLHVVGA